MTVDNNTIAITNPNKILFPDDNITKLELIRYYAEISPFMLPYLKDRPLSMERFPNGIYGKSFFQKDAFPYFPSWIVRKKIPKSDGGFTNYVVCQNQETLIYLANLACITIHLWLSKIHKLRNPDKLIFDIDPPSIDQFKLVKKTALSLESILKQLGLNPFLMTTGSKGLHIIIPIDQTMSYENVQHFARGCAHLLMRTDRKNLTMEFRKEKRDSRIFIDIYRNEFSATAVSPFSVRPKPKAPVATPLHWEELESKSISSQSYTIKNIFDRIQTINDPWKNIHKPQSLIEPIKNLISFLQS